MNHSDHSWENCPDLNPAPKSEATRWYPLLRKLHAAGWEHIRYGAFGSVEHAWYRNRLALNQQKISLDEGVASIEIDGVTLSATGLSADLTDLFLLLLGAFRSAPPAQWRHSEAVDLAAKEALLTMAASDPELADDTFVILRHAIEGKPL